jgi:hypothetical protein
VLYFGILIVLVLSLRLAHGAPVFVLILLKVILLFMLWLMLLLPFISPAFFDFFLLKGLQVLIIFHFRLLKSFS